MSHHSDSRTRLRKDSLVAVGYVEAARITRARARSFAFASVALEPGTRRAAYAVYAFCRRCDDAVDGAPPGEAPARLAAVRDEVASVYAGDDRGDAILAAFGDTVRARGGHVLLFNAKSEDYVANALLIKRSGLDILEELADGWVLGADH